jgi:hypothetical protein
VNSLPKNVGLAALATNDGPRADTVVPASYRDDASGPSFCDPASADRILLAPVLILSAIYTLTLSTGRPCSRGARKGPGGVR